MITLIRKFWVFGFLFLGTFSYAQEKKHFSNVSSILQNIIPNVKATSWLLIHSSYGKDRILKQSGAAIDYVSQTSGFNIGIAEENEFYYIVYVSGGRTEYITTLEGLKNFVGKPDDIQDAAISAATDGYIIDEEFRDIAANYYEDKSNYYLNLGKLTSTECPYQKKHFTLTISKSTGIITEAKDNGSYIELYNKKCTNNPRLLKIEKKEEPKDEPKKKPTRSTKRK
ncbi:MULTISPECIES: hypothetical protein [Chryseobacterium]|uniref:Uncharacterized protein n=1 Tax=Candidatus Chryseobacterium massiliense TaxID=204089 RepID=A0A3D9AYR6_9FLAO|nr:MULTISPECIES: hypothetical protein [Chryseobacterium]REC46379.1 hypothetical protein DRF68_14805 [Candidatus Chryseobacterium massiliae]